MLCASHAYPGYKPSNHILVSEPIITFLQVRQISPKSTVLMIQLNKSPPRWRGSTFREHQAAISLSVTASDSREKLFHPHEKLKSDNMKRLYIYTKDKVAIATFASSFPCEQHDINTKLLLKMSNTQPS